MERAPMDRVVLIKRSGSQVVNERRLIVIYKKVLENKMVHVCPTQRNLYSKASSLPRFESRGLGCNLDHAR